MKNDYSFKLVAAIVIAGVIVALFSPTTAVRDVDSASIDVAQAHNHAE